MRYSLQIVAIETPLIERDPFMVKRYKKSSARKSRVLEAKGVEPPKVREPSERTKIKCPACPSSESYRRDEPQGLRRIMAENSRSRFVDAWICSDCGVEEALHGFFWRDGALKNSATAKLVRTPWR